MAAAQAQATVEPDLKAFNNWRRSLAQLTGLGLNEEEKALREQQNTSSQIAKDCKRCERWRDGVIAESPIVRFMLSHIDALPTPSYTTPAEASTSSSNGTQSDSPAPLPDTGNSPVPIYCSPCGPDRGGGFAPDLGVVLCQDRLFSKKHVEDTLAHELVHEWDHRRFKVDWNDLRMVACSEIRAASLSGDCRWGREIRRRNFTFTKQHQACTKRRATLSVLQHHALAGRDDLTPEKKEQEASRLVNEVWQSCWNDTRPFDEIY